MKYLHIKTFLFSVLVLFVLSGCREKTGEVAGSADVISDKVAVVTLSGADWQTATDSAVGLLESGLTSLNPQTTASYTSPVLEAPQPFNYVVPEWQAQLPPGSALQIKVRTSVGAEQWSEWYDVQENPDMQEEGSVWKTGTFIERPESAETMGQAQFQIDFIPSPDGKAPVLTALNAVFIDATGPTTQEILSQKSDPRTKLGLQLSRPKLIARTQWCDNPACNYGGLRYTPVTHLFIHHTVSNNKTTDWAGNVRAIWLYHTNKNGWEDIGYHYLVDPNGVIYEGHLGGDDVVGIHASLANRGSMAVALLGTFSTVTPPEPMVNSVVNLFSWKAEQKNIALWEASRLPDMDWGLLHLAGHRDAFGTTECPGTLAHAMIDQIRQRIGERLDDVSPHLYVDDRSAQFSKSAANWYEGPKNCGFNRALC